MLCVILPFTLIYFRKSLKFYFNFPFSFYKSKQTLTPSKKKPFLDLLYKQTQYLFDCIYQLFSIKNIFWLQSFNGGSLNYIYVHGWWGYEKFACSTNIPFSLLKTILVSNLWFLYLHIYFPNQTQVGKGFKFLYVWLMVC